MQTRRNIPGAGQVTVDPNKVESTSLQEYPRLLTSRLYKTEQGLQQMQGLLMEARSRTNEGLRRMQARGMNRVCISTGVSDTLAIRLYESIGFEIVNKYLDYVKSE